MVVDAADTRVAAMRLAENINRTDLAPHEIAEGVADALENGMTADELADSLGWAKRHVYRYSEFHGAPEWLKAFATGVQVPRKKVDDTGAAVLNPVTEKPTIEIDKLPGLKFTHLHELDDVTYARQREMLLSEKHSAMDRLSVASEELDDKYLASADRIFELAKRAKSLWNQRSPSEQRQLLELVLSNSTLDGVEVRYEMKKPFAILSEMAKGPDWRARCDSNAQKCVTAKR